jgi:DNA-cytosine methyltransferase
MNKYRVLDLFSGAGGFSKGLDSLDEFKTVLATDFNKPALDTFKLNFPDSEIVYGDITDVETKNNIIDAAKKLNVNMIIGGPPCQGFSNKGKKLGLKDPRNFLFREYLFVVEKIKPEIFVIENVKAMLTASNGYFLNEIIKEIERLGYFVVFQPLLASDFGVPQNRQRAVIIACKNKKLKHPVPKNMRKTTVRDAISDLSYLESGQGENETGYSTKPQSDYQKKMRMNSKKLYNHKATNHNQVALDKLKLIPEQGNKNDLPKELHGNQKFKTTWGRLKWDEQSPTIDTRFDTPSNGTNSHPVLHRSITPREAARIQSFPDDFVFIGRKTEICKQIGNAVPPLLARAIGKAILGSVDG